MDQPQLPPEQFCATVRGQPALQTLFPFWNRRTLFDFAAYAPHVKGLGALKHVRYGWEHRFKECKVESESWSRFESFISLLLGHLATVLSSGPMLWKDPNFLAQGHRLVVDLVLLHEHCFTSSAQCTRALRIAIERQDEAPWLKEARSGWLPLAANDVSQETALQTVFPFWNRKTLFDFADYAIHLREAKTLRDVRDGWEYQFRRLRVHPQSWTRFYKSIDMLLGHLAPTFSSGPALWNDPNFLAQGHRLVVDLVLLYELCSTSDMQHVEMLRIEIDRLDEPQWLKEARAVAASRQQTKRRPWEGTATPAAAAASAATVKPSWSSLWKEEQRRQRPGATAPSVMHPCPRPNAPATPALRRKRGRASGALRRLQAKGKKKMKDEGTAAVPSKGTSNRQLPRPRPRAGEATARPVLSAGVAPPSYESHCLRYAKPVRPSTVPPTAHSRGEPANHGPPDSDRKSAPHASSFTADTDPQAGGKVPGSVKLFDTTWTHHPVFFANSDPAKPSATQHRVGAGPEPDAAAAEEEILESKKKEERVKKKKKKVAAPLDHSISRSSPSWDRKEQIGFSREGRQKPLSTGGLPARGSRDASDSSWLSFLINDSCHYHDYNMFDNFPGWAAPTRSYTHGGNLAPITTNTINLELCQELDPTLAPLYDILRSGLNWEALNIEGATSTVTDRVRLTPGQIGDATNWTIIEELACRPVHGLPVGLFTVPKKDPKFLRLIVDGRPWNQTQIRPPSMEIPRLIDTIVGLQRMKYAVQYDGVSMFYQFRIDHDRCFFRRNGKWHRFCRMPMGWSWAPAICQRTANAIMAETVRRFRKVCPDAEIYTSAWVDNFILSAMTEKDLGVLESCFLELTQEVSLELKKVDQKDLQHTVFAGIEHDLLLTRFRPLVSTHVVQEYSTLRDVMRNCGCSVWQLYGRARKLCYYRDLLDFTGRICAPAMRGEHDWDAPLARFLRKDDHHFLDRLKEVANLEEWETIDTKVKPRDNAVTYSDASSRMWAFSTDMTKGAQGHFKANSDLHIFIKEGLALLAAIRVEAPKFRGKVREFRVDNLPLVYAFAKGHSPNVHMNFILQRIDEILKEQNALADVTWISTHANLSDRFTRGDLLSFPVRARKMLLAEPLLVEPCVPNFLYS